MPLNRRYDALVGRIQHYIDISVTELKQNYPMVEYMFYDRESENVANEQFITLQLEYNLV